jgi:2-keto-4-pentenoate hydratase/2-oxohepta-3-ene-1,7-dioic acid hydratase in catechol pathway
MTVYYATPSSASRDAVAESPVWLHDGDVMELGIEGPGNQRQNVGAAR